MALLPTPEASQGIGGMIKGALGLFGNTNKAEGGISSDDTEPRDEYDSSLSDLKIVELTSQWKSDYSNYYDTIKKSQELNFSYWVGNHRDPDDISVSVQSKDRNQNTNVSDNLIFSSTETFLPVATRSNPEPLVACDSSPEGQQFQSVIKSALVHFATSQVLRRKLAKGTRSWLINKLGAWEMSWNPVIKTWAGKGMIELSVPDVTEMGFDPEGFIDEKAEFIGDWLFKKKKQCAEDLIVLFPKAKDYITLKVKGKMGTKVEYYEWWYKATDLFYTVDEKVLGKFKNPNWNYDTEEDVTDPMTGQLTKREIAATNFLPQPCYPFRFLGIFSLKTQPHDETGLIDQNISQQDKINRLEKQIDQNVKGMNNGIVVNGQYFTDEQAGQAAAALRAGKAIRVPTGNPKDAVLFPQKPALPSDVFRNRDDARNQLANVFGVTGLTSQGIQKTEDVRGKMLVNQADSSRIGGGVTEYLEQVASAIYNLYVQFMYVYYDEEHYVADIGASEGSQLIALKNSKFPAIKTLTVSVKEGSLIPKDPLSQRNEAIDLWSQNAIDPLTFYKRLDFPDPAQATNQLILWKMFDKGQIQPQMYLPTFQFAGSPTGTPQQGNLPNEQPGTGGPAVSPPQQQAQPQAPELGSHNAIDAQSQQLMQSVPIPR